MNTFEDLIKASEKKIVTMTLFLNDVRTILLDARVLDMNKFDLYVNGTRLIRNLDYFLDGNMLLFGSGCLMKDDRLLFIPEGFENG